MHVESMTDGIIAVAERGWVPDAAIRMAIRRLCGIRLKDEARARGAQPDADATAAFVESLRTVDVAAVPEKANAQHYEVPPELFRIMLGPRLKYSCCWWSDTASSLAEAEDDTLALTVNRAGIVDGMRVLELGCGWGSLSIWMAQRFPGSEIVGVSNSKSQRRQIEREAQRLGLSNLTIHTADMNAFAPAARFDRIVSVEMFEHMRNYHALLDRIGGWLLPGGELFVHVFCHRRFAYLFEEAGAGNWMGRHFFSGGVMPSADLLPSVPSPFFLDAQWTLDGTHYARTAEAWLANLDALRGDALSVLADTYGDREARQWLGRWRMFLMACAELFAYGGGNEWGVSHYRFRLKSMRAEVA